MFMLGNIVMFEKSLNGGFQVFELIENLTFSQEGVSFESSHPSHVFHGHDSQHF